MTPGGSSIHLNTNSTQNMHTNYRKKQHYKEIIIIITREKVGVAGRAPSLRVIPWNLPYNRGKSTEKPKLGYSKSAPISRWLSSSTHSHTNSTQNNTMTQNGTNITIRIKAARNYL
jgi:hypothetical protein